MNELEKIKAIPLYGQTPIQVVIVMASGWLVGPYCEDAAVEYAKLRAENKTLKSKLSEYTAQYNGGG